MVEVFEDVEGLAVGVGADAVRETLQTHGLKPSSFGLPVDLRGDNTAYEALLARLASVDEAALQPRLDANFLWSDDRSYGANFNFHQERLVGPAAILAEHGIRIGLKSLGPKSLRDGHLCAFVYTVKEMLELCGAVGSNVGLLLDAWHWYTSGYDPADLELLSSQNVVDVHVNDAPAGVPVDEQVDSVRCLPGGTGVVEPFNAPLQAMAPEDAVLTTAAAVAKVWREAGLDRV